MANLDNEFMQTILDAEAWKNLSGSISWTETLLEKCKDKVDWAEISHNTGILWTIPMLDHFKKYINWDFLSQNINEESLSPDMVEAFKNQWNWHELSDNGDLVLTDDLLQKYIDLWDWEKIINRGTYRGDAPFKGRAVEFYNLYKERISATALQDSNLWDEMRYERKKELLNSILK